MPGNQTTLTPETGAETPPSSTCAGPTEGTTVIVPQPHCFGGPTECEECRKQIEDAERKARELDEKEREMRERTQNGGQNASLEGQNGAQEGEKKKEEQERTRIGKKAFRDIYPAKTIVISEALRHLGIGRRTYYKWMDEDPDFRAAVEQAEKDVNDFTEDKLMQKIKEGHGPSIRYRLDRRHPKYKPHVVNELIPGNAVVFEDFTDPEYEATRESEISRTVPEQDG